jgi:hypothetical protein
MPKILDTDFAMLTYFPDEYFLQLKWKKQPDSKVYRQTFQQVLRTIQEDNIAFFVSDISQSGLVDPDDLVWLNTEIIPPAIKAGLRKIALVMDPDIFKQYYISRIAEEAEKGGIFLKIFDDYQEAIGWLKAEG